MPELDVSVVLPARNEERLVRAALVSIAHQTWPLDRLEAIVVANGCSDQTAEAVRAFSAEQTGLAVTLVEDPEPGVARAKNLGAARAGGRLLLFLDADSRMKPDLAEAIVRRAGAGEQAGSIRMIADTSDALDRAFFRLIEFGKRLFAIRANMLYCTRETFERLGGFDARLQQAEDREFLVRLQRAGIAVGHVSESWIATSPRRLHALPLRLGIVATLGRWALGHAGIGRDWPY